MARDDASAADTRRALDRLRALSRDPAERSAFGLELLQKGKSARETIAAAAEALEAFPLHAAREALGRAFSNLQEGGARRDPGGMVRATVLRALRPVAGGDDVALFARAARTYEPTPQDPGAPGVLRAAAIVGLSDLDQEMAAAHAARLLGESETSRTSIMNGEPAITAARVLAYTGHGVALYLQLVRNPPALNELRAECVRGMVDLPGDVLGDFISDRLAREDDLVVLLGYCDLALTARHGDQLMPVLAKFMASTGHDDVFGYLAAAFVASRRDDMLAVLSSIADGEFNRKKLALLERALTLAPQTDAVSTALVTVRERLG